MTVLTEILDGAITEANSVSQLLTRQGMLNTVLSYNGQQWYTRDLAPMAQRIRNQLQNLLFAVRTMIRTQPARLYQDQSVILSLYEQNDLIGWRSGRVMFSFHIMQYVAQNLTQAQGQYLAFCNRLRQFFDIQYETRIFMSLFFHSAEPAE